MEEKFITSKELTDKLNIDRTTLYRWINLEEGFPAKKFLGRWKFKESEVMAWLEERDRRIKGLTLPQKVDLS